MGTVENIEALQRQIVRSASSEEELQQIVRSLTETNWVQIFYQDKLKRTGTCKNCRRRYPYGKLVSVTTSSPPVRYCRACVTVCPSCGNFHQSYSTRWLYPLCEACTDLVDRSKLSREDKIIKNHLRRATHAGTPASLVLGEWIATLMHFSWRCAYCTDSQYEHFDHFLPLAQGGGTTWQNCVPACRHCNALKSYSHPSKVKGIPQERIVRVQEFLSRFL